MKKIPLIAILFCLMAYPVWAIPPSPPSAGGSGDFAGPSSSTDGHVVVFDGSDGKKGKDGGAPFNPAAPGAIGGTTAAAATFTKVTLSKSSGVAGVDLLYNDYLTETFGVGWLGPTGTRSYNLLLQLPAADPTAGQAFSLGAVTDLAAICTGLNTPLPGCTGAGTGNVKKAVVSYVNPCVQTKLTITDTSPTAAQLQCCNSTTYNNKDQTNANLTITLPTAAIGLCFYPTVSTQQQTKYWRFTAASAGTIYLDGSATGKDWLEFNTTDMVYGAGFGCSSEDRNGTVVWYCSSGVGTLTTD